MAWFKKASPPKTNGNNAGAQQPKVLLVLDYLSEESVLFFPSGAAKEEILFKLVGALPIADHASALNAVLEREKMGGTLVESSIAIPHARIKSLKTIALAIGIRAEEPRLFFLFLSPKEDTKTHLLFLSSLSSLFQTEGFAAELLTAKTPHEVVQKIRQFEKGV